MRNLVQDGLVVPLIVSADTLPGALVNVGAIVGVAVNAAPSGGTVQARLEGVFEGLPGATGTAGTPLFYDPVAEELTAVATDNVRAGVSLGGGLVRLNGSF